MGSFSIWHWLILLFIFGVPLIIAAIFMGIQRPITVVHKDSGMRKTAYVGFSWTYLLFGWMVPLVRGEIGIAALHFFLTIFTFGLTQIIFCFLYNKQNLSRLLLNGWVLDPQDPNYGLASQKMGIS